MEELKLVQALKASTTQWVVEQSYTDHGVKTTRSDADRKKALIAHYRGAKHAAVCAATAGFEDVGLDDLRMWFFNERGIKPHTTTQLAEAFLVDYDEVGKMLGRVNKFFFGDEEE